MRLIDEHKATDDICEHVTTKAVSRVVAILQSQPTVEAIPVDWIREWQIQHGAIIAGYISYMLLDWERKTKND